jgi:hypothetical protein
MPSEWVGVAGTAIGAGIGGVVTVAALIIKGRQDADAEKRRNEWEDRRRRQVQALAIRQLDHSERRDLYRRLRNAGQSAYMAVVIFSLTKRLPSSSDDEEVANALAQANDQLENFAAALAETDITSFDDDVIEHARSFSVACSSAVGVINAKEHPEGAIINAAYNEALRAVQDAYDQLLLACRRDLYGVNAE